MTPNEKLEIRLHHIGFVVRDIQAEIQKLARSVDATCETKIFNEPLQKVKVSLIRTVCPGDAQIELAEPAAPDSPVLHFLKKSGGLHHLSKQEFD